MIGADILDKTGQNAFSFGRLREEPAWWELDTNQRKHFDEVQRMNQYLREEYHQLQDYLWGSGYGRLYAGKRLREVHFPRKPFSFSSLQTCPPGEWSLLWLMTRVGCTGS